MGEARSAIAEPIKTVELEWISGENASNPFQFPFLGGSGGMTASQMGEAGSAKADPNMTAQ